MNASRLLVLVEDTTATRDLWPVWQRQVLEPLLKGIETGQCGEYELALVSFASVDGQSDGLLRSGNWTRSSDTFRGYCQGLTFEGSCTGNGLAEAAVEAAYLARQPSTLGSVRHHILLCATGNIGRLPVVYPFERSSKGDIRVRPLTILAHMVSTLRMTVSILTECKSSSSLPRNFVQLFNFLVSRRKSKIGNELCMNKQCLMLLDPDWHHGYSILFPEYKMEDEVAPYNPSESSGSTKTYGSMFEHLQERRDSTDEAAGKLLKQQCPLPRPHRTYSPLESFQRNRTLPDAVDLSSWFKTPNISTASTSWIDLCPSDASTCEVEFAQEKELLGLDDSLEDDLTPEKESKLESSASYDQPSPAYSSNKQPADQSDTYMIQALPEDGDTSSPMTHGRDRSSKTISSAASASIDTRWPDQKRPLEHTIKDSHSIEKWSNHVLDSRRHLRMVSSCPPDDCIVGDRYGGVSSRHHLLESELHDFKRLRTNYSHPVVQSSFDQSVPLRASQERMSPSSVTISNIPRHSLQHPVSRPPQRTVMPSGGFDWNVEWSGPLYLAGHLVDRTEHQKLFDIEILCKRTLSDRTWPSQLVVNSLPKRVEQPCTFSCNINIKWESLTDAGRSFGKWLTEEGIMAVVKLPGEESSHMIISIQDASSYEHCQLVAGFQTAWNL